MTFLEMKEVGIIKLLKITVIITITFFLGVMVMPTNSNAVLITSEDFEGGATGWSINTTETGNANFTEFLGRHSGGQYLYKIYSLSGTQNQVTISFDFYEIDSWDDDFFKVWIDDGVFLTHNFHHNVFDDPLQYATPLQGSNVNLGFGTWQDQTYTYTLITNITATSIKLGFTTGLDQGVSDESWGIDNVIINDNSIASEPIPEPTTMALLGIGLAGLGGRYWRRRKQRADA